MQSYRDIYKRLTEYEYHGLAGNSKHSPLTDDLLREQDIDVDGEDSIEISIDALLIHYAERIKELEARVKKLENK